MEHHKKTFNEINELCKKQLDAQKSATKAMVNHHEDSHDVEENKFQIDDFVLAKNYGKCKMDPFWYGPLQVVHVTPLSTYQLKWGDGELKNDLVHQDHLKLAVVPQDDVKHEAWFAKTHCSMESFHDNSSDGLPDGPALSEEDLHITENCTLQAANEDFLYCCSQIGGHQAPIMGTAAEAAWLYCAGLAKASLPPSKGSTSCSPKVLAVHFALPAPFRTGTAQF